MSIATIGKGILKTLSGINIWIYVAAGALVASGWGYSLWKGHQLNEALKDNKSLSEALVLSEKENETLRTIREADTVASDTKTAGLAEVEKKEGERRVVIEKILKANPAWADAPVPRELSERLRDQNSR